MSRRHADIWSHPSHYLVDPYTWAWSPKRSRSHLTLKIQMSRSWPRSNNWGMKFNRYVCFSFRGNRTTFGWCMSNSIFDLENSRARSWSRSHLIATFEAWSWPWDFKVKFMAKVKPGGHIWGLEFNQCVFFLFCGNRTIFGWDIVNSLFDLANSRSRSRRKSTKI